MAFFMVAPVGPLATRSREPGQTRKGATVAVSAGAGVWLAGIASLLCMFCFQKKAKDELKGI